MCCVFFFFSSRRRHTRWPRDWSSDVCSSDLAAGPARWKTICQQALGDGILDATQPRRREVALPQDDGRKAYIELQQGKVKRALDVLETEAGTLGELKTIGEITIGCALGYLDFRYPNEPWRPGHPRLEAWYAKVSKLPPLAETGPVG